MYLNRILNHGGKGERREVTLDAGRSADDNASEISSTERLEFIEVRRAEKGIEAAYPFVKAWQYFERSVTAETGTG